MSLRNTMLAARQSSPAAVTRIMNDMNGDITKVFDIESLVQSASALHAAECWFRWLACSLATKLCCATCLLSECTAFPRHAVCD